MKFKNLFFYDRRNAHEYFQTLSEKRQKKIILYSNLDPSWSYLEQCARDNDIVFAKLIIGLFCSSQSEIEKCLDVASKNKSEDVFILLYPYDNGIEYLERYYNYADSAARAGQLRILELCKEKCGIRITESTSLLYVLLRFGKSNSIAWFLENSVDLKTLITNYAKLCNKFSLFDNLYVCRIEHTCSKSRDRYRTDLNNVFKILLNYEEILMYNPKVMRPFLYSLIGRLAIWGTKKCDWCRMTKCRSNDYHERKHFALCKYDQNIDIQNTDRHVCVCCNHNHLLPSVWLEDDLEMLKLIYHKTKHCDDFSENMNTAIAAKRYDIVQFILVICPNHNFSNSFAFALSIAAIDIADLLLASGRVFISNITHFYGVNTITLQRFIHEFYSRITLYNLLDLSREMSRISQLL